MMGLVQQARDVFSPGPQLPQAPPVGPVIAGGLLNPAQMAEAHDIGCYMYSLFGWAVTKGGSQPVTKPSVMAQELSAFATARAMFGPGTDDSQRNVGILKGEVAPATSWEAVLLYVAANVEDWCPQVVAAGQPMVPPG